MEPTKKMWKKVYQNGKIIGKKLVGLKNYSYVYTVMREIKMILIMVLMATGNECRMRTTPIELESTPKTEMINKPLNK